MEPVGDDMEDREDYTGQEYRDSVAGKSGTGSSGNWKIVIAATVLAGLGLAVAVVAMVFALHSQSTLSRAERQTAAAEGQVSALKTEMTADENELSTAQSDLQALQSTVTSISSLSAFTSKVCNDSGVYDDNTGQTITAYYPCTDDNPNG